MSNAFATGGTLFCLVGAVLVIGFVFLANAIRIIPEYQRLVVFRLGRVMQQPKGPGIVLLIPVIDRAVKVDLREQIREVPHQVSITKDNAPISIDFLWYYKILDPAMSVLQVGILNSLRLVLRPQPCAQSSVEFRWMTCFRNANISTICSAPVWMK